MEAIKSFVIAIVIGIAAILLLSSLSGCATNQTLETRVDDLEKLVLVMHETQKKNIATANENVEILNTDTAAIKQLIEVLKLHDEQIKTLEKLNSETHF